jgi:A/G-specific adenine glycosylase
MPTSSSAKLKKFRRDIRQWYKTHARSMPWRNIRDPYKIYISEVMLQQTQVDRVRPKYLEFIKRFPTFTSVSRAPLRDILAAWQGLGYNRRAAMLKKSCEMVVREFKGKLPQHEDDLLRLPGIGAGTAGSLMAFAHNKPSVFIETNIRRAFIHAFFPKTKRVHDRDILAIAAQAVDRRDPRTWYYALMDYGAALGKEKKRQNPNRKSAHYVKQAKFEGSLRQLRGKIIRTLLAAPRGISKPRLEKSLGAPIARVREALAALAKENIVRLKGKKVMITS